MKKIINPILFSLLVFGCSDDLENSQQQSNYGESLQFESLNFVEKKELLEKSENVLKIYNLSDEVKKSINEKDFQKLIEHKNELIKELDILYNKYGKTNFNNFMVELEYDIVSNQYQIQGIEPTLDDGNDKCKRNDDGTVNYSACTGFWENFMVTVRVAFCPDYPVEELYKCAQDAVCKTC